MNSQDNKCNKIARGVERSMQNELWKKISVLGLILPIVGANFVYGFNTNSSDRSQPFNRSWLYVGGSEPGNYTTIQSAINAANSGDQIYVYAGIYYEQINVPKSVSIIGQNNISTIVFGGFNVFANYVAIQKFTIKGGYEWYPYGSEWNEASRTGICVWSSAYCNISQNIIQNIFGENQSIVDGPNCGFGGGIYLESSNSCIINRNMFSNIIGGSGLDSWPEGGNGADGLGVALKYSSLNTIRYNSFSNIKGGNSGGGKYTGYTGNGIAIYLYFSTQNILNLNSVQNIIGGFGSSGYGKGFYLESSSQNEISQNAIRNIIGGLGASGSGIGIDAVTSSSNSITFNTIQNIVGTDGTVSWGQSSEGSSGGKGIGISYNTVSNDIINGNSISYALGGKGQDKSYQGGDGGHGAGLYLWDCTSLFISENIIQNITGGEGGSGEYPGTDGMEVCVFIMYSLSNGLIFNNIFNNKESNVLCPGNTKWNITKTLGENIIGGPYLGGNYWSDYTGIDGNNDGLGDMPYSISGSNDYDYYPLVNQRPIADAGGPYTGFYNEGIVFDASDSYAPNGDPLEYNWDFDNNGVWDTGWLSSPTIRWYYDDEYTGQVKLQVRDMVNPPVEDITTVHYWKPYYFIHITDPHVVFSLTEDIWEADLETITNMNPPPDFVLCTGDLVDFGEGQGGPFNYDELLDNLHGEYNNFYIDEEQTIPIYFCPGNHDAMLIGDFYNYYNKLGPDYWTRTHKNCAIFSLNSGKNIFECGELTIPEGDGIQDYYTNELTNFVNDVAAANEQIKIVMVHHPYLGLLQPPNQELTRKTNNTNTKRDQTGHIIAASQKLVGGGDEIDINVHIQDDEWGVFADEYRVYIYDENGNQRDCEPDTYWKNLNGDDCWLTVSSNNDPFWDIWDLGATYRIELWEQDNGIQDWLWMTTPGLPKDGVFWNGRESFLHSCNTSNVDMVFSGHMHNINRIITIGEDTEQITTKAIHGGGNYYRVINVNPIYPNGYSIESMTAFSSTINGQVECQTNVHIYDELGNHNGLNATGEIEIQIPLSTYSVWKIENETENINRTRTEFTLTKNNSKNYTIVIESIVNESMNVTLFSSLINGNWTQAIYSNVLMYNQSIATIYANESILNYSMNIVDVDRASRIIFPTVISENQPPELTSNINGPTAINTGETGNYSIIAIDPNNDDVYYWFEWGDGTNSSWLSPYHSNETCRATHTWQMSGNYEIKVKTKDDYNLEGNWSEALLVQIFGNTHIKYLQSEWNFIALPFNQSINKSYLHINYNGIEYSWQQAVNNTIVIDYIFGWDRTNQIYQLTNTLTPGEGYWMFAYHDCQLSALGIGGFESDAYITDLLQQWNLIGSPNNALVEKQNLMIRYNGTTYTWQDAVTNNIVVGSIFQWNETNQNYQLTDVLQPGKSYWMYAYYNCTLLRPMD